MRSRPEIDTIQDRPVLIGGKVQRKKEMRAILNVQTDKTIQGNYSIAYL